MRLPNSYGSVVKLSGKRRKPYAVRLTLGWTDDGKQIQKYISYHAKRSEAIAALRTLNQGFPRVIRSFVSCVSLFVCIDTLLKRPSWVENLGGLYN